MFCIYRITNKLNGHTYIGQHKYTDNNDPMGKYKGSGKLLKRAYNKYGIDKFETEILYRNIRDKSTVDAMEIWAIKKYKPEYNIAEGGSGGITWKGDCPSKGKHHSMEARMKMSKSSHHCSNRYEYNVYWWNRWIKYNISIVTRNKSTYNVRPFKTSPFDRYIEYTLSIYNYHDAKQRHSDSGKKLGSIKTTLGKHWYNNGSINVMRYSCPEGFKSGYIPSNKQRSIWCSEAFRNKCIASKSAKED